ncbi:hypothetical protein HDU96_002288 [Phlyctochytrium bullatum]|nr:hypothetical protein HDU96_002288 [Phlyctochytrium bullatum]
MHPVVLEYKSAAVTGPDDFNCLRRVDTTSKTWICSMTDHELFYFKYQSPTDIQAAIREIYARYLRRPSFPQTVYRRSVYEAERRRVLKILLRECGVDKRNPYLTFATKSAVRRLMKAYPRFSYANRQWDPRWVPPPAWTTVDPELFGLESSGRE